MPRTLAIDPRVPTSYGLIIRRQSIAEQTRAHITIKEARGYARRIVKQAQLHSESIRQEAMQQGFDAGWQDSLAMIYQSLRNMEQLYVKTEQALKQVVHNTMGNALAQSGVELQLLESWLSAAPRAPAALNLVLPRHVQAQTATIIRRIEEALQITPTVSIGDSDCIIIECGDQVFEFAPSRTMQETDELAKNCLRRLEVKKQYTAMTEQIVQAWLSDLAERHSSQNEIDAGFDERFDDELFDDDDDEEDDE